MASSDELDLDLIAALIDGRLSGADRERAIKQLTENEAAFEIYTDAMRVRPDLPAQGREVTPITPIIPIRRRPAAQWRAIGSLAAAAALFAAGVPRYIAYQNAVAMNAQSTEITTVLARRPDLPQRLVGNWDAREWSVTRGESVQVDSTLEFRLGVRAVDLNVALAAGDTARAGRLTGEIVESLVRVRLSDLAKAEYAELAAQLSRGDGREDLATRATHAERTLDDLLDSFWFRFGRWTAGGELAARTQTTEFFEAPRTRRFLNVAAKRAGLERADAEVLGRITSLTGNNDVTGEKLDTLRQLFETLIRRHGG
jgi:hypothetical protein